MCASDIHTVVDEYYNLLGYDLVSIVKIRILRHQDNRRHLLLIDWFNVV